jgi:nucleoside-diphosphate-sugar epimerase
MRKLIIGCGYLGERVAREWKGLGDDVCVLTRSAEHAHRFESLGLTPIVGDVLQADSLKQLPNIDTVLYAVGFDRNSGQSKRAVYVDGLRNVLSLIASRCRRLIYVSSTSVYGQNDGSFVDEASPTEPIEESGRICLEAESVVWQFFAQALVPLRRGEGGRRPGEGVGAFEDCVANRRQPPTESLTLALSQGEKGPDARSAAIVLRLAGLYGPGRLLARIEQLQRGEPLSGNPAAWLNLIHVDDAVRAVLVAEQRGGCGETYLVCDDRPLPRVEYYSALAARVGAPPPRFAELAADAPERRQLNKRCVNRWLREELNVRLQYPTVSEGLSCLHEVSR